MNLRNIDVGYLRTFLAVIDLDGFNRAAVALNKSQSTVSAQMKKIEESADTDLFEKAGRRMRLTHAGEKLVPYARRLVALHDLALEDLRGEAVDGTIRLAVMDDYAIQVLPHHLASFMDAHPLIDIEVSSGFSDQLMKGLGLDYDLVLSTHPVGVGTGERLCIERTRWVFAENKALPDRDFVPLALLPKGNLFRGWALKALDDGKVPHHIVFTGSSIATVEAAAAAGLAVTIAKERSAMPGLRFLEDQRRFPILPDTEIMLNSAPDNQSPVSALLARHLRSSFAIAV